MLTYAGYARLEDHSRHNARELIWQILIMAFYPDFRTTNMNKSFSLEQQVLRDYLSAIPAGEIAQDLHSTIINLLTECWDGLQGSEAENTFAFKLARAEQLTWNPPCLEFILERHGGTVNGSINAELHTWVVDLDSGQARCATNRRRRLHQAGKRLDINGVVQRIAEAIVNGTLCQELEWRVPERYVLLNISAIVPSTNQQTTSARRKQFREALKKLMLEHGWSPEDKGNRVGFRHMPQLVGISDTDQRPASAESPSEIHETATDA